MQQGVLCGNRTWRLKKRKAAISLPAGRSSLRCQTEPKNDSNKCDEMGPDGASMGGWALETGLEALELCGSWMALLQRAAADWG